MFQRRSLLVLLLVCALLFATRTHAQGSQEMNGEEIEVEDVAEDGGYTRYTNDQQVANMHKAEQIAHYEDEANWLREHEVQPALHQLSAAQSNLRNAKSSAGWFPNAQQKEAIRMMDDEVRRATAQLNTAKSRENAIVAKIKPLYGIVSYEWMQEQQVQIKGAIKMANEMAYNQAWWDSMFQLGRAESFTDLIVNFLITWLIYYVIFYPFAALYYLFWSAPWSIYAYSSSSTDLVVGIGAWLVSAVVVSLPLLALAGAAWGLVKVYGPEMQERMRQRREYARPPPRMFRQF